MSGPAKLALLHGTARLGKAAPSLAVRIDGALGPLVEYPAAALLALEIVVMFAGIVSRYVFHSPLVWSDELGSILFLWIAMLGAVIAARRGEHMRMTAIVGMASPSVSALLEALATSAGLAFLIIAAHPALEYAMDEQFITTPAMHISGAWRAAALPVGIGLMIVTAVLRLALVHHPLHAIWSLILVAVVIAAVYACEPLWRSLGNLNLVVFFVIGVALCVFSGVPIAFSFGLACFGYLILTTHVPTPVVIGRMEEGMSHLILLSVPLFVFLGLLIEMTGMAKAMVAFLASLLGHVRGGLQYVLVGAMYLVSGISGSKAADMAAITPVLFPEMKARGADEGDLIALLAATGAQTETIPPSIVLLTIGSVTGVSITALFTGGLLPGFFLGALLCTVVWFRYRREDLSEVRRAKRSEIFRALAVALPAMALPFIIRLAVMEGVATATEVSTIGIAYSVLIGMLFYRQFDWRKIVPMLVQTVCLTGAILLIIGAATSMAWALTQSGFSTALAQVMAELPGGAYTFMAVSVVTFIILGSVLEGIPAVVLFGPLLFPIARSLGIHDVHYAMVVILAMGVGLFAPPFGIGYYTACAIARVIPIAASNPSWAT